MSFPKRYLTRFGPKQTPHLFTDILVIGGGIAGLRAALAVPSDLRVVVVTKDRLQESNSTYAQGGIAAVSAPEDHFDMHIKDTLAAGAGLCDTDVVKVVVEDGPDRIEDLLAYGTKFNPEPGLEGGHSYPRILHAHGDATGAEIMRAMIERVRKVANVTIWEKTFTLDLLTSGGACVGAHVARSRKENLLVWAKQTILASGGAGVIFRETTNPPVATGDGMAAAYRAGAELRDMEFMQFHPTVLYVAGSSRYLVSEAVRGFGAYLRDKDGHRFMFDVPEAIESAGVDTQGKPRNPELATRDIVAKAIVRTMSRTQHPNVYLDLSHLDPVKTREHFPGIARVCREFGLDIATDSIPVRPGAHYMIGGVKTDSQGRTTLPGLWAAGEVTSSGLHGANRLASNSLLEGLVFGERCGRMASEIAAATPDVFVVPNIAATFSPDNNGPRLDITDLTNALRGLMMRSMGVVRDRQGLLDAEKQVAFWCRYVLRREFDSKAGWEFQNMLTCARLMIWSALQRTESRGVHFRSDYPRRDDENWQRHISCPAALP